MIFVYGTGENGQIVMEYQKKSGKEVKGYLISDNYTKPENMDMPVFFPNELKKLKLDAVEIFVAVSKECWDEIAMALNDISRMGHIKIYYIERNEICSMNRSIHPVSDKILSTTIPISNKFGFDRGMPIDRFYINKFLNVYSQNLKKASVVFEVGDSFYSKEFFPSACHEILDYSKGMDLTQSDTFPNEKYDVFICTQVLNFIYDVRKAIKGTYDALKAGGTLLATVAGNISQVSRSDMENYGDYWRFTYLSIKKLISEVYGEKNVSVIPYGNALAATTFVQGMALEDISDIVLLNETDADYAICIGIIAKKRG